jgi:hypothetical protein
MSPLQRLILDQMRRRGWTPADIEARGVTHPTLHRYMNPVTLKSPPRQGTQEALAKALDLPLVAVKRAALASVGWTAGSEEPDHAAIEPVPTGGTDVVQAIQADGALIPEARQQLVAHYLLLRRLRLEEEEAEYREQAQREREETLAAERRESGQSRRKGPDRRTRPISSDPTSRSTPP